MTEKQKQWERFSFRQFINGEFLAPAGLIILKSDKTSLQPTSQHSVNQTKTEILTP